MTDEPSAARIAPPGPVWIVIVEDDVCAQRPHTRRAALARGRDHTGAALGSELHDHPAGDACGPVDQDRLPGLNVERLGHHLVSRKCGNGKCCCLCPEVRSGLLGDQARGGNQSIGPAALVAQRQGMGHHAGADARPLDLQGRRRRPHQPPRPRAPSAEMQPHIPTADTNELFPVPHPRGPHLDQNPPASKSAAARAAREALPLPRTPRCPRLSRPRRNHPRIQGSRNRVVRR